jgi:cell division protein ZapB
MTTINHTAGPSSNNNSKLLIIVGLLLLASNLLWFYYYDNKIAQSSDRYDSQQMELVTTYAKLDSVATQLDNKILELKYLGKDIDSLVSIKNQLEKEKRELATAKNLAQSRYNDIKDKLEIYENLLKKKDEEIARLKETADYLAVENYTLKEEKNVLNSKLSASSVRTNQLEEKLHSAATLKAINIRFIAVNSKGKEKEGTEFKAKQLSKIKVLLNIEENKLAEIGTKKIYMRLLEPEGSALYNAVAGSSSFTYLGREIFYTAMQEILFDNTKQQVSFEYDKGTEFKTGQYTVEIYSEGAMIGINTFIVN